MPENDVNNTQAVTEPEDADKEQVVTAPGETIDPANQTEENQAVPYERFKEVNDQKKAAEEQTMQAQRDNDLLRAQMQGQQMAQPQQIAQTTLDQAMINCGVTADDMYGEAQVRVFNEKSRLDSTLQQQQMATNENMQFINSHPDFSQVVGSVNPATGQIISWSQEALKLGQEQPWLQNASAQGMYQAIIQARELAEFKSKAEVNQEHLNRQGVNIASQPLGGSAAGGGGAGDPNKQQMYTREQVAEIERKLANGEEV